MRRFFRHAAILLALASAVIWPSLAGAQDSFLERFIRAGNPAPTKRPVEPTPRHNPSPSHAAHRSSGASAQQEEQIKTKTNPSTAILVIGDALADKLAQGIDQEFADNPDVQVVRKTKSVSSLTRVDIFDWVEGARAALAGPQHYDAAVILIGINDWQPMQSSGTTLEPGSDAWRDAYGKRVEALLGVFKEKNLPVVWVGLPAMSLPKFSEQLQGLNAIVRDATHAAGGAFVDLHDAFIGEDGKYTDTGPALNGATVRLRTSDGVSFTQAGALKAAYFADVEVKRILAEKPAAAPDAIMATPGQPGAGATGKGEIERLIDRMAGTPPPADAVPLIAKLPERPAIGPIISLTTPERASDGLLAPPLSRPAHPLASSFALDQLRAAKPGRSDDFSWQPSP
jgi:uncharacterized protein